MTDAAIARELGITPQAMSQARQRGITGATTEEVKSEWSKHTRLKSTTSPRDVVDREERLSAIARLNLAKARREELKADREEKSLVPAEESMRALEAIGNAVKLQMLSFPDEKGSIIAAELGLDPAVVRQVIRKYLHIHIEGIKKTLEEKAS